VNPVGWVGSLTANPTSPPAGSTSGCQTAATQPTRSPPWRILVTGMTGFVGPHLLRALQATLPSATHYIGWGHRHPDPSGPGPMEWQGVDLCDAAAVDSAVQAARPTHVIHLAALSHVPTARRDPAHTWQVNLMGTLHLLEAVRRHAPAAGVLHVNSSEVYGGAFADGRPVTEDTPLAPRNPYATSKAAADLLAGQYAAEGLRILRIRPFNHVGPGQSEDFVLAAFAAQIARIEAGLQEPVLRVGNLDAQRDFLDVRDTVAAYGLALTALEHLPSGTVLNLASGQPRSIRSLLDGLLTLARVSVRVEIDPRRLRPSDIPLAAGDARRARQALHWAPRIPWAQTLATVLEDGRARVRQPVGGPV